MMVRSSPQQALIHSMTHVGLSSQNFGPGIPGGFYGFRQTFKATPMIAVRPELEDSGKSPLPIFANFSVGCFVLSDETITDLRSSPPTKCPRKNWYVYQYQLFHGVLIQLQRNLRFLCLCILFAAAQLNLVYPLMFQLTNHKNPSAGHTHCMSFAAFCSRCSRLCCSVTDVYLEPPSTTCRRSLRVHC
jgi:hypothetical protein